MGRARKRRTRPYRSPTRETAAARTREAIVRAAQQSFEAHGWSGTTVRSISGAAGVSQKTVEALFGTKASLLQAAVDYAIRGDIDPAPMTQRESVAHMEAAPDARTMLDLHATHLRTINERSARLAWAVEHGAAADATVAGLWRQMNHNRAFGVQWAAKTLFSKPGRRPGLTRRDAASAFWIALDWGTYRTLTEHAGLTPARVEAWLRWFYRSTLLDHT